MNKMIVLLSVWLFFVNIFHNNFLIASTGGSGPVNTGQPVDTSSGNQPPTQRDIDVYYVNATRNKDIKTLNTLISANLLPSQQALNMCFEESVMMDDYNIFAWFKKHSMIPSKQKLLEIKAYAASNDMDILEEFISDLIKTYHSPAQEIPQPYQGEMKQQEAEEDLSQPYKKVKHN